MAFNPISIEGDSAFLDHDNGQDGPSSSFPLEGDGRERGMHSNMRPGDSGEEWGPFTPNTSVAKAARMCREHYHLDFSWAVPYPKLPDSPLLYFPAEWTELLTSPAAIGVMQTELDAMSTGVLERIPLAYYPMRPGVVRDTVAAAVNTERHLAEMRRRAQAAGQLERLLWRPEDVNPTLSEADARLLDTDLDGDLVLRRDLPSLTLLQRPLYTDMGLVPQEERHSARLARIVPPELRHLSQGAAGLPGSPLSPTSPLGGAINTTPSVFETEAEAKAKRKTWAEEVNRSFRNVRALDDTYDRFLESLVHGKLGLDKANPAHLELGRALWLRLFDGTTRSQQRGAWYALCRFSFTYDQSAASPATLETASRELRNALSERQVPGFAPRWTPLLAAYLQALAQHTASLPGGAAERKAQLHFSDLELDPQHRGGFVPELEVGSALQRKGKEFGENHARLPIFPVEVIPVFPSAFVRAAKEGISVIKSAEGELDYLAESAEKLHHVVLPGATVPENARDGPHVLVGDTNLLVADATSTVDDVADGAAVSYHTAPQNTYEALFHDEDNTSSYLLRLHTNGATAQGSPRHGNPGSSSSGSGDTAAATAPPLKGAMSKDGKYITYDRVGWRDVYTKASNVRAPPFQRHVLVFAPADEQQQRPPQEEAVNDINGNAKKQLGNHKRAREASEEDGAPAQHVKVEA